MNNINNTYSEKEIKNKLKNFKEGKDYSVSPTEEPEIKTYSFFSNELKSWFGGDRVPIRVIKEAYDGKDYTYRGHFEEGKDYHYSRQHWHYGKNYQGKRGTDIFGDGEWKDFMDEIKWDEHYRESSPEKKEFGWVYRGKGKLNSNEPEKIPTYGLQWKHNLLTDKLSFLLARPESDFGVNGKWKKESEIAEVKKDIAETERLIEKEKGNIENSRSQHLSTCKCRRQFDKAKESWMVESIRGGQDHYCSYNCAEKFKDNPHGKVEHCVPNWLESKPVSCHVCGFRGIYPSDDYCENCGEKLCDEVKRLAKSDLEKENYELKQELTKIKGQLAAILEELKKLKKGSAGQNNIELDLQIARNEKLIKEDKISESEIKEQLQKSEALLKGSGEKVALIKDKNNSSGSGSLPYVIGGSVIFALVAIISYYLLKRNRKNKKF